VPILVTARSMARVCGRSLFKDCEFESLRVGWWHGYLSLVEWCVLLCRGLCDGRITRLEEPYGVWCAWVWYRNFNNEDALAHLGLLNYAQNIPCSYRYKLPHTVGQTDICINTSRWQTRTCLLSATHRWQGTSEDKKLPQMVRNCKIF